MAVNASLYAYVVSEESYSDQSVIVREGGHGNWIYLIIEGRVKVKRNTAKGMLTTDTLEEGDIFGALALLGEDSGPRKASVVADGQVVVGLLDTNRLVDDLNTLSPHMRKFISTLVKRLDSATDRVVSMVGS
jgi:CRP-like cAMP-binding protein